MEKLENLDEVVNLFMQENDKKALKKLYKITNDSIVKILLDWKEEYEIELQNPNSYQSYMYEDIMSYVWDKYKLNEINKEEISIDIWIFLLKILQRHCSVNYKKEN